MNKKVYIAIGLLILIVVVISAYFILQKNKSTVPAPNNQPIVSLFPSSSNPDKSVIKSENEKTGVEINDPYKIAENIIDQKDLVLKENPQYQILYFNYGGPSFLISILSPDIESARASAENDFLTTLGISKDQACKLNVSLAVSTNASKQATGANYGLSFCPNGKPFPK